MKTLNAHAPQLFEIYFLSPVRGGSAFDRILAKGIKDIQQFFGYEGNIGHIIVRLGNYCYELTKEGTVVYEWTEEIPKLPRVVGWWTVDLDSAEIPLDNRVSCAFVLGQYVSNKRKLEPSKCISYVYDIKKSKSRGYNRQQEDVTQEFGGRTGVKEETLLFTLPFTCCSLATSAMWQLFGLEPEIDECCPIALFTTCFMFAAEGFGDLHTHEPVMVEFNG